MIKDNTPYYNAELAYDFSLFEERSKPVKQETIKISRIKKQNKTKFKRKYLLVYFLLPVLIIYCVFSIYLRVKINETEKELSAINTEITELDAEKIALDVKYANLISYDNLTKAAKELGMRKMQKDQIIYIHVNTKDTAKIYK